MNMSELFNLPKNRLPEAKSLQTQIIMGNQSAKMSWSDRKTHYLQGTSTLYVEGDAQKTKPKTIWRGGGGIYRRFVGESRGSNGLLFC